MSTVKELQTQLIDMVKRAIDAGSTDHYWTLQLTADGELQIRNEPRDWLNLLCGDCRQHICDCDGQPNVELAGFWGGAPCDILEDIRSVWSDDGLEIVCWEYGGEQHSFEQIRDCLAEEYVLDNPDNWGWDYEAMAAQVEQRRTAPA